MSAAADRFADLPRAMLQLAFLGAVIAASLWILRPFLGAFLWAIVIVVASWPPFLRVCGWLGGWRGLGVAVMTVLLLSVLVLPLYVSITTVVVNADRIAGWSRELARLDVPTPPEWLAGVPLVGSRLSVRWQELADADPEERSARLTPYAAAAAGWFVGQIGGVGRMMLEFLLMVVITTIVYARGEALAEGLLRFGTRLAGAQGAEMIRLAGQAVRAVALGVVVTALVQALLAGLGLWLAGVPFAAFLTAVMFILGIAQIGPVVVLAPAVYWVFRESGGGWGTVFLVWAIFCGTLDNVLRTLLIKRGADLPLPLILAGVIGGLVAFGVVGLFVGPAVLAVGFTLLSRWIREEDVALPGASPGGSPP